jgi:RNA polymerase sigma factor (sigma-70 family)
MLEKLPLPEVIAGCRKQTECFRRNGVGESHFCLELWRRAIDLHESEAWQALVEQYSGLVRYRLRQTGLDEETVEEAVQQTFVNLWLKSREGMVSAIGRTLPEVLQYLLNTMRFAVIAVRRQQRDLPLREGTAAYQLASQDGTADTDTLLDARVLLARIHAELYPHEWRVLQLRYLAELPPREIATVLSMPVDQVYLVLASVKRRLRARADIQKWHER